MYIGLLTYQPLMLTTFSTDSINTVHGLRLHVRNVHVEQAALVDLWSVVYILVLHQLLPIL